MVTAATCSRMLGALPCTNKELHKGNGQGCTHDAGSGIAHQPGDSE
jgi:hypothetical protein